MISGPLSYRVFRETGPRTDNFVNVNVLNNVTSARVLSYHWVLHYFSTIPVGGIKIVTIYKRSIFQVEWLIATLILCNSHCSELNSVSSRVFYSAVSTAPRFLLYTEIYRNNLGFSKDMKAYDCTANPQISAGGAYFKVK